MSIWGRGLSHLQTALLCQGDSFKCRNMIWDVDIAEVAYLYSDIKINLEHSSDNESDYVPDNEKASELWIDM